jgi:purine-nucleoside phosphorylase
VTTPTPHNAAVAGQIADACLLPGDPARARVIAERFLDGAECVNEVRNMLAFTGNYRGRRVSVMGTGMGMPSISIYVTELFRFYGVRTAIRVGSCGALQESVHVRDVVIALSAGTDSAMHRRSLGDGVNIAATASYDLVAAAVRLAGERGLASHVGSIFSSDTFYEDDPAVFERLTAHGVLAVEMEAAALYTLAARHGARALCVATVSDHLLREEAASAEERQNGFLAMAELALDTILATDPQEGNA